MALWNTCRCNQRTTKQTETCTNRESQSWRRQVLRHWLFMLECRKSESIRRLLTWVSLRFPKSTFFKTSMRNNAVADGNLPMLDLRLASLKALHFSWIYAYRPRKCYELGFPHLQIHTCVGLSTTSMLNVVAQTNTRSLHSRITNTHLCLVRMIRKSQLQDRCS